MPPGTIIKDGFEYEDLAALLQGNPIECWRNLQVARIKHATTNGVWTEQECCDRIAKLYAHFDRKGDPRAATDPDAPEYR